MKEKDEEVQKEYLTKMNENMENLKKLKKNKKIKPDNKANPKFKKVKF